MEPNAFETPGGVELTAVTAEEMRAVDRVATETVGLPLLSMMENAGRNLAGVVEKRREGRRVVVFAGGGGNGGGGLACARHLHNCGVPVAVVLDRDPASLSGATATQHRVLDAMEVPVRRADDDRDAGVVAVDALVGYGLTEALRGRAAELAVACNDAATVVSLDVPTGVNATTGEVPGPAVEADATLTLALPKTGLGPNAGDLLLGDIGIPAAVYEELDVQYRNPFEEYVVRIRRTEEG
ncbi:NAD(P)H-hydrate epimerase [Natronomonas marina]|uniref:NAD(P)H-hydrate epimerase n=1 Tax=Natronomonas marina TaxID=2961939 RepID=UPI0020CA0F17|nr:NAD(P)H-hydrate epimerase [Natronomonas marina]